MTGSLCYDDLVSKRSNDAVAEREMKRKGLAHARIFRYYQTVLFQLFEQFIVSKRIDIIYPAAQYSDCFMRIFMRAGINSFGQTGYYDLIPVFLCQGSCCLYCIIAGSS